MVTGNFELLHIIKKHGFKDADNLTKISGGDINSAFRFSSACRDFFIKTNIAEKYPELFAKEANGLNHLRENTEFKIPAVISCGIEGDLQFLMLEYLAEGRANQTSWEDFARRLAEMHGVSQQNFGFFEDNYLGTQFQDNSQKKSWSVFYAENRILPSMKQMFDRRVADKALLKMSENLCKCLPEIYPDEAPSLVHGDLWSGNFHVMERGDITLIDPAVYYGHREMDLAMAKLFGGFPEEFYVFYEEFFPLQPGFRERVEISQLYPLIFHAIRFGGSYVSAVEKILKKFN